MSIRSKWLSRKLSNSNFCILSIAVIYDLYIDASLEGYFEIDNQQVKLELNVLTEEIINNAGIAKAGTHRTIKNLYGGAWLTISGMSSRNH